MTSDPRHTLSESPMSPLQIAVVTITVFLNALDGFDVMSISFASPGIANEWGVMPGALGIVLSMELIGMAIGSAVLGGVADKIGRRPTILGCLTVMTAGMLLATTATNIVTLSIWRVVTGLGIGGMLAAITAVSAEFSNARRRHLSVSLMSIGYPLGAVFGGMVATRLLAVYTDWRWVFYFGAAVTAAMIPVVFFLVPESVQWLARKQPAGALDRMNAALRRMGHAALSVLPDVNAGPQQKGSGGNIFAPALLATTVIITIAYFFHITTFYFIVKWVPKIVVGFTNPETGLPFPASVAGGVLVWVNVGGALGGAILGLLTTKFPVKVLTIGILVLSTVAVAIFGRTPPDLQQLSLICGIAGFCTNAGIIGLYAIIAQAFPTHVRASGTGFAIGVGRGGSVLAPIIAGFLFEAGYALPTVALTMASGSLFAAAALTMLKLEGDQPGSEPQTTRGTTGMPAPSRA